MSIDEWVGYGIPEDVIEDAIAWIVKLDGGQLSENERSTFFVWLDDDPTHRWAFEELSEIWARTSVLKDREHLIEKSQVLYFPVSASQIQPVKTQLSTWLHFIAIGLIATGVLATFFN